MRVDLARRLVGGNHLHVRPGEGDWQDASLGALSGERMTDPALDTLCINTIRTLAMDAVQQANSGHPGTPMAMAPVAYTLWQRHLRFDPEEPIWPNRDRFVLSAGHASMLLYALLHLTGVRAVNPKYETLGQPAVTLDDIRRFRQLHNGIEYALMAAYAEGLNILRHATVGLRARAADAETTPLRNPEYYQYDLNLADIAEVWRRGSVIASWLLDLTAAALASDPTLARFAGRVSDSGEGRWTLDAAIDEAVPAHVLAAALFERFASRGEADFQDRLLSAMRFEFGGHLEKRPGA